VTAAAGPGAPGARPCEICRIQDRAAPDHVARFAEMECWRDGTWVVRHHLAPAPLVGWTFVGTVRHVQGAADLTDHEAAELGPMLRRVSRAVRALTGCDRVYAIAFGQGAPHLHVHLIPRFDAEPATAAWNVADWYRAVERGERPAADPAAVADFVRRLRGTLESTAD
jgi:diadenosine tetraphosphate (Ap4A) HIT family hydrolase